MKTISINEYNSSLGKLIDIEPPEIFIQKHFPGAINIPYETLLYNRERILDKNETYYIYCQKGNKSKRAMNILTTFGYKIVQVLL